jgi:hypothetical protein
VAHRAALCVTSVTTVKELEQERTEISDYQILDDNFYVIFRKTNT